MICDHNGTKLHRPLPFKQLTSCKCVLLPFGGAGNLL
uniref:Uncharacterized protein n=1 Tax=Anguilla anguilla TaxID=7936 RepID=A0A0E9RGL2_ANGAN